MGALYRLYFALAAVAVLKGVQTCVIPHCETDSGMLYKTGSTWTDPKGDPCVTYSCESSQESNAEVLISYKSCDPVVCPNGKAGYKLPGQCCESCNYDTSFELAVATGTASVDSALTILQPTWGEWSNWTECSRSCGGGRQSRVRECLSDGRKSLNCTGNRVEVRACNTQCCPVNGGFASWSGWSNCSVTCGNGTQNRTRSCSNPAPACGGDNCTGAALDLRACVMTPCPVDCAWSNWTEWSACNQTCNGGWHYRTRSSSPALYGGKICTGPSRQDEICNPQPCPVDGYWKAWSEWSACSVTCNSGIQTSTRQCVPPLYGGKDCVGNGVQTRPCELVAKCPIDCQWTDWGNWSRCSVTCDGGTQTRSRQFLVSAQYGGKACVGDSVQTAACNSQPCPNPCKDRGNPCYNSFVTCTPISETKFQCGPCPVGLTGNGITCSPVNECNLTTPCFPGAQCTDQLLGYSCGPCPPGYSGAGTGGPDLAYALTRQQKCSDIDECAARVSPCNSLRLCINTVGSYLCGPCPPGYINSSSTDCLLTNPCVAKLHNCEKDEYCLNTAIGAFSCQCPPGMYGNGVYCIPYGNFDGISGIPLPTNFSTRDGDVDHDGILNDQDNCLYIPNMDQTDSDKDGIGDMCDNCRLARNANQADLDKDGFGDVCDNDEDGDTIVNTADNCPRIPNPSQKDTDKDGFGDACDNCILIPNNQADSDYNGVGDACDNRQDKDKDGRQDNMDNCPQVPNADQADADGDGMGDKCENDCDNDRLLDLVDSCPLVPNPYNDSIKCAGDYDGDLVLDDVDTCPTNAKISTTDFTYFTSVPLISNPSLGIAANWIAKNATDIIVTTLSDPYLFLGSTVFSSFEYSGTFYVGKTTGHGYFGIVFNYQSNKQFMVAAWKKDNETIPVPGRTERALAGMQIKLIDSTTGPSNPSMYFALWNTGDTSGQLKTVWKDPKFQGWEVQQPYKWKLQFSNQTSCMRLTTYNGLNMQLLTDSGCICGLKLMGGRVGVFSFNQDNVIWTNLQTKCYTDQQMKC
eukprot:Em0018g931a